MEGRTGILPGSFVETTRTLMGEERFARYLMAFSEEPPVSIRVNPLSLELLLPEGRKNSQLPTPNSQLSTLNFQLPPVPWCPQGFYLPTRPNFTFDPLLHAGCYYVQEAASMFLSEVLRQHLPGGPVRMLDLCAAPGGKSTLALSVLPQGSVLFSNEPVRQRAAILLENITKWGGGDRQCIVTNCYARDYRASKLRFDVILCDVPCSGEGMFRKDAATIGEWSPQQVERCWRLQRDIVSDAWACLSDGGLLIYSTCTFNTRENEENIAWMMDHLGARVLPVEVEAGWGITGSLLPGFSEPVSRFIPGITRGEGLFMCALRKGGAEPSAQGRAVLTDAQLAALAGRLNVLTPPQLHAQGVPTVDLDYGQAIAYLRREALTLPPQVPRGLVEVTFMGHPLGLVKNLGNRANNLYPKEWRIKSTHVPQEYTPVLGEMGSLGRNL